MVWVYRRAQAQQGQQSGAHQGRTHGKGTVVLSGKARTQEEADNAVTHADRSRNHGSRLFVLPLGQGVRAADGVAVLR